MIPLLLGIATLGPISAGIEAKTPRVWAVVVGVDRYEDTSIPPCSGAVRDALSVADWMISTAGWGRENVLRVDDYGRKARSKEGGTNEVLRPTRDNLEWAISGWLAARVEPGDIVMFYFAGQATAVPPREGGPGRAYLLPIDAALADVERTGFSLEDALDRAGSARKARVILWLDTSTRGRGDRGIAAELGSPSGVNWLRALTRWPGVSAWLAADDGRPAPESGNPGPFVASIRRALGTPDRAHNILGCLDGLRDDPTLKSRGFRAMGGIGPGISLWRADVRPIELAIPELVIQAGHGDRITSAIVTPDHAQLITASRDSTVRVWSLADRSLVRALAESIGGIEALALNRDGTLLMAGDALGRIAGWDMTLDRPRRLYGPTGHDRGIAALAFLPDGRRFVSLDKGGASVVWDGGGGVVRKLGAFSGRKLTRIVAANRPEAGAPAIVAATEGGPILPFDSEGHPLSPIEDMGARVGTIGLSDDGRTMVLGDDSGRVILRSWPSRNITYDERFDGPIGLVRLSPSGPILIVDGLSPRLVDPKGERRGVTLDDPGGAKVVGEVERAEFSDDGRWLACSMADDGRALAWRLADPARPSPARLPGVEAAQSLVLAFAPDGKTLISGDADGGVRSWGLDGPSIEARPSIPPARGKVAELAASPSGQYLLEITKDDRAIVWDLKEGRGARALPGSWLSGAFLADESKVALVARPDIEEVGGDVVLFDHVALKPLATRFERPFGRDGKPSSIAFGRLAVSRSGRLIAAIGLETHRPMACVWRVDSGRLVHAIGGPEDGGGLTSVEFSGDESSLLIASADGKARVWPINGPQVNIDRPAETFVGPGDEPSAITVARFSPAGGTRRVAAGSRAGGVFLWTSAPNGRHPRVDLGPLDGEVNAVAFSSDGRWLAASASRERTIRFWSLPEEGRPRAVTFAPSAHHAEQVGALLAWPGGSMIASGGDDAAVRFWDLKEKALAGTLLVQARGPSTSPVEWLAYTPDGLFDGSRPGESMLKWRVGGRLVTLEQSEDTHHSFRLASRLLAPSADRPRAPSPIEEPPTLKIVAPPADRTTLDREVELTLWSGDVDLDPSGLRLYQNGVPVRADDDIRSDRPHFARAKVRLRKGENRFYAMASKPGAADGRSDEVVVRYDGPEAPGRLHTIALGIGAYRHRPLKYAHIDAKRMAGYLHDQGLQGVDRPGERIVLLDEDVNPHEIDRAFLKVRAAVKGHPEDTVVLFLAGHTDTDARNDQFCLLLPQYPFDDSIPAGLGDVALRGVGGPGKALVGDVNVLPYVVLYNRMARLEAMQRLVIVDACQAGAILDDPAVRNIQRLVERGSRKARNSYLLAARRGEPATEADALEHGLLTYALLRGMGAPGLKPIPADLGGFPGAETADLDGDGVVSTDELTRFADDALPRLARLFPQVVLRAGVGRSGADPREPGPDLERKLRIQAGEASFPLIALPPARR